MKKQFGDLIHSLNLALIELSKQAIKSRRHWAQAVSTQIYFDKNNILLALIFVTDVVWFRDMEQVWVFLRWRIGNDRTCSRSQMTEWRLRHACTQNLLNEEEKAALLAGADGSGLNATEMFDMDILLQIQVTPFWLYCKFLAHFPSIYLAWKNLQRLQKCVWHREVPWKDMLQGNIYLRSRPDKHGFLSGIQTWCTLYVMIWIWYIQRQLTCFQ